MKRTTWMAGLLLLGLGAAAPAPDAPLALRHFELSKSTPEAGAEVHAVDEVRLWFTQEPQVNTTSIRVVSAGGEALATGEVTQDEADKRVFSVALDGAVAPGRYTVAWRAMGQDGHVVRDDFSFTVMAH